MRIKAVSPVIPVGVVLTVLCLCLYVKHPFFVQAISNYTYDTFIRAVAEDQKSDTVAIVDLDDPSLLTLGQWPWPRFRVAELTKKILEAGASVVAFDVVFPEKDRTSPAQIQAAVNQQFGVNMKFTDLPVELQDFDQLFAESLKGGQTILGCCMRPVVPPPTDLSSLPILDPPGYEDCALLKALPGTSGSIGRFLIQSDGITISIPELSRASKVAFFNAVPDFDSVIRSNPIIWGNGPDRVFLSLALQALRLHTGKPCVIRYNTDGVVEIRLGDIVIPTDGMGRVVVNYRSIRSDVEAGFSYSFPTYSAMDVLRGRVTKDAFKDKVVFIGASAVGLKDIRATPLTQYFSGVEVHATIVDNVLAGDVLTKPPFAPGVETFVILLMGLFMTFMIARGRSWLSFLIACVAILATIQVCIFLITHIRLVFVPGWVILSIVIIYPVLTMIKFWQEEIQKKQVRDMFGTMVSSTVLHYLESHPGSFSLSGQKAEATMFFSDVAGFTTISENLEPGRLSELLNRYLSPMTEIILQRGGYVDKYEGDLIMAEWGVPYAMHDHAVQACHAAIEQQARLAEIRPLLLSEFGHEVHVRMGLNSGTVTAGNMGSSKRFQYTVMGDAVNQAARFEPVNKDYGTSIVIGETTYEAAKAEIAARQIDLIVVKGKTRPIGIYELVGLPGKVTPAKMDIMKYYEDALRLHWKREWDSAVALLEKVLALDNADGPSLTLLRRIQYYRQNPPPANWSGQFTRAAKD